LHFALFQGTSNLSGYLAKTELLRIPGLNLGWFFQAFYIVIQAPSSDWKYEKSRAGEGGGGRTHTFGVEHPAAKLKACAVYRRSDIMLSHGKPIPRNGNDDNGNK